MNQYHDIYLSGDESQIEFLQQNKVKYQGITEQLELF